MSDRTSFIYYWYWRNYLYLGYNYGWVLILHCTLKASNLHGESSVFRRILNAFQDKLSKINDYKNECWILDGLLGNLLQADISRRIECISIGDITDVRDITTAEILILPITLKPSSWNLSVTTFLWMFDNESTFRRISNECKEKWTNLMSVGALDTSLGNLLHANISLRIGESFSTLKSSYCKLSVIIYLWDAWHWVDI